ncbi:sodium:proton antiporter [Microbacterium sp. VKM Ac-2870]|uniref:sodium:proton antiporter n=1 Tax=Microbacterium sp. VKM Ac-2870 TaxID=2783825 RepID=UPI00188A20FA|nr:sodium:proton antiporter [Microbacterium sp. VKM Ac-2870]MBF4562359.1 sodium:proton antiporter [Microbacterium sp. VKM Ac-2870]
MPLIFLLGFVVIGLWSVVAHRFERTGVAGPAVLAAAGAGLVFIDVSGFAGAVGSESAEHVVELILAVLLFVDACEVRGGVFGGEGRSVARLVLIALPLSLVAVVVTGEMLMPSLSIFVLLVVACVIMPTDFAPAATLLRSRHIPARVRQILNVESGYNDGLISPIFGMALAAAIAWPTILAAVDSDKLSAENEAQLEEKLGEFFDAFFGAVPATLFAIAVGAVIGGIFGLCVRWASRRGWADASGIRYVMLLVPVITFSVATLSAVAANGFVAAFVAGIVYRIARTRRTDERTIPHEEIILVDEAGTLAANIVWFVLGAMTTVVILDGFDGRLLVLVALALTVFRIVPVYLAMLGSSVSWSSRTLVAIVGPRGTATIVFGLLAFNKLPDSEAYPVLAITVFTVVGSILLHGVIVPQVVKRRMPVLAPSAQAPASADR